MSSAAAPCFSQSPFPQKHPFGRAKWTASDASPHTTNSEGKDLAGSSHFCCISQFIMHLPHRHPYLASGGSGDKGTNLRGGREHPGATFSSSPNCAEARPHISIGCCCDPPPCESHVKAENKPTLPAPSLGTSPRQL